ncbi:MAG: glutathione S-transferase family protein [Myxococcota bacterium]
MRLYSGPLSLFTAKVRIALAEKGCEYERIEVGWSVADRYLPHHPDVAAHNPKAEVPVLVDGDLVLYDSTVLLEYLEDRNPHPPLYPADAAERARCRQLEAAADEILFPPLWDLIEGVFYATADGGGGGERVSAALAAWEAHYARLDKALTAGPYLCGDYSVADIGTFVMCNAAGTLGASAPSDHAAFHAWDARMRERPAVAQEVSEMGAAAAAALGSVRSQ